MVRPMLVHELIRELRRFSPAAEVYVVDTDNRERLLVSKEVGRFGSAFYIALNGDLDCDVLIEAEER